MIDYRARRFEERARDFDLVLDLVGGETLDRSWRVLAPDGAVVSTAAPEIAARTPAFLHVDNLEERRRIAE